MSYFSLERGIYFPPQDSCDVRRYVSEEVVGRPWSVEGRAQSDGFSRVNDLKRMLLILAVIADSC